MSKTLTGGCLCKAVRYEISTEPAFCGRCYCEDCRRVGGTGHVAVMAVEQSGISVKGELAGYSMQGGSGKTITRHFCPTCGSRIYTSIEVMPGTLMVTASSLDDPEAFSSQMSIYVSHAPSWDQPPAGETCFAEMPPPQE